MNIIKVDVEIPEQHIVYELVFFYCHKRPFI